MTNDIGYICEYCSHQWGNWASDSYRELSVCHKCEEKMNAYNPNPNKPWLCPIDCGDNSCVCAEERKGMRTNGGCRCDERSLRLAVQFWKREALKARESLLKKG